MSAANGTSGKPKKNLDEVLNRRLKQVQLIEANAKLRAYKSIKRRPRRLTESWEGNGGWIAAWGDGIDRSRLVDDDFVLPLSTANDVRYGDFWPFWRSWLEQARLRAASRLLHTMSPLASGAIANVGAYVIGEGMQSRAAPKRDDAPKPLLEAVQTWLDDWEEDNDWLPLQIEAFDRAEVDGEVFLRLFPQDDGWTVARVIEPMFVLDALGMPMEMGKYGVITDPEDLCDVRGFWVSEDGNTGNGEQVSSALMRQLKVNVRRGVKRGMPTLSYDTLDLYKITGRLIENMGTGAAIQAAIAFVRQHEIAPGSAVSDFVSGLADYDQERTIGNRRENVQRFDAGTVVDMDAGQKFVETGFAKNVQNYTAAVQALLRAVAVRWGAPEWVVSADASNSNYSSSLTAESPFVKRCKQRQSAFVNFFRWAVLTSLKHFCKVKRGVRAAGRLWLWEEIDHFCDIQVTPPTVETRNRVEESQLNRTYIELGVKSRQTVAQELNLDFEREERNNTQYEKEHGEQGVPMRQRAGEGGGGPDDPMANIPGNHPLADAGIMGANRDGDGKPDDGHVRLPVEGVDQQQPGGGAADGQRAAPSQQSQEQQPPSPDDLLASAGLDDLFGGLGLPEQAPGQAAASDAEPAEGDPDADMREKVGIVKALNDLQTAVYAGEIPREAAIANAHLNLQFSLEDAQKLFPKARPVATADDGGEAGAPAAPQTPVGSVLESVRRVLDGLGGGVRLTEAAGEWTRYTGPRGGDGWRNGRTGEILYQDEDPNHGGRRVGYVGDAGDERRAAAEKEHAVKVPYKTRVKDRVNHVIERLRSWIEANETPEESKDRKTQNVTVRLRGDQALYKAIGRRGEALARQYIDNWGSEIKQLRQYRQFRDSTKAARWAASEVVWAIGTDGEAAAVKKMELAIANMLADSVELSDAANKIGVGDRADDGLFRGQRSVPDDPAFPPSDEPRDRRQFFKKEADDPPPEELRGVQFKRPGPGHTFNGRDLSRAEEKAIRHYTGKGYDAINGWLRLDWEAMAEDPLDDRHQRTFDALRGMFAELKPAEKPMTLYRGLRLNNEQKAGMIDQIKQAMDAGEPIRFAGYSSCSRDPGIAELYGDRGKLKGEERRSLHKLSGSDVVFEIAARRGLNIGVLSADDPVSGDWSEDEVLLDHDSEFNVAAIRYLKFIDADGKENHRHVVQLKQRV